jgi:DnaA regulatory inactivator Hda
MPMSRTVEMPMQQLPLPLPVRPAMGAADFIVTSSNQAAVAQLERWPDWPARIMLLQGAAGAGKTHVAQVWARLSGAVLVSADTMATRLPELLQHTLLILDDVAPLFGNDAAEQALFHLCNHAQQGGHLLLTSTCLPHHAAIALPDLASRLRSYPVLVLQPPDDALLAALLLKHFHDRQLRVSAELIAYLLPRIERSAAAAAAIVQRLDAASLAKKHTLTVPLARAVLEAAACPPLL